VAPGRKPPAVIFIAAASHDIGGRASYINSMRALIIIALFALLILALWFAGSAWIHLGGDEIPLYGYVAIAGGVLFSLLVGGGLMALVFYSNRHGYDDLSGGDSKQR
jgi:hypothetical protein